MLATDWVTISSLATAGGTLVLAAATFAAVRSANRAARVAEQSLLAELRPMLMPTRFDDPEQKVGFADEKWLRVRGGGAAAESADGAVYLAIGVRNVGTGIAVLHGWFFHPLRALSDVPHAPPDDFRRLTRDLYVAPGDVGFWQGAFRDPGTDEFSAARACVEERRPMTVDVLYGDYEGGQRVISRFSVMPAGDDAWIAGVSRHWNIDRPDPR